jgi:serine acetyltransferase
MLTRVGTLVAGAWPVRWMRTLFALSRGVRIHPSAVVAGGARRVRLARGCTVGARSRFLAGGPGRIVVGEACWFASDVELDTTTALHIGAGTTVQRRSSILGSTRIGRGCILAPNVFVSSGTHPFRSFPELPIRRQEALVALDPAASGALDRPVWIQDDCWLGANVVVCPGVVIGRGSVVGANAVVLKHVPPYSVVAGVPARVVGKRLEWIAPRTVVAATEKDQIYVLSGRVSPAGEGAEAAFTFSADEPLHVAIAAAGAAAFEYLARQPVSIRVGGQAVRLEAGRHWCEVDSPQLRSVADHRVLVLETDAADADVRILRMTTR